MIDMHLALWRIAMEPDAVYTVANINENGTPLNDQEQAKLLRRGYTAEEVALVVITFQELEPDKVIDTSRFAAMQVPTNKWSVVAPILPIRMKNAGGDNCILASLQSPRQVRLVIERDSVLPAMDAIAFEMRKFNLELKGPL